MTMISVDILANLKIFAGLDPRHLEALASISALRTVERGACVFHEGEPMPPCFHILALGTIQIVKSAASGKETAIRLIGPGEVFAWAAILDGGLAPASARALTPARVIKIPQAALLQLLAENPQVALRLLATLSERLRDVHEQLHAVVSERARTRLARLILRHHAREGASLKTPLPHQVLSRMAGITYEESVRIVGEWAHSEPPLLEYGRGGKITVLEPLSLEAIAEGDEPPLAGTGA